MNKNDEIKPYLSNSLRLYFYSWIQWYYNSSKRVIEQKLSNFCNNKMEQKLSNFYSTILMGRSIRSLNKISLQGFQYIPCYYSYLILLFRVLCWSLSFKNTVVPGCINNMLWSVVSIIYLMIYIYELYSCEEF